MKFDYGSTNQMLTLSVVTVHHSMGYKFRGKSGVKCIIFTLLRMEMTIFFFREIAYYRCVVVGGGRGTVYLLEWGVKSHQV